MVETTITFSIFLIFAGAALFATVALYARQAMIVAYIVLGLILGPWGLGFIDDADLISDISSIGIIFLLYLLGLDLFPRQLWRILREATVVTFVSTVIFIVSGFVIGLLFSYETLQALLIGRGHGLLKHHCQLEAVCQRLFCTTSTSGRSLSVFY